MIGVVARKELVDHIRDRRSVLGALVLPLVGPLLTVVLFAFLAQLQRERPLEVAVVGDENAPALMAFLREQGIDFHPTSEDDAQLVTEGELDAILEIDPKYAEYVQGARSAPVRLVVDSTKTRSIKNVRRLENLLRGYAGQLAGQRLVARGVAPELAQPLDLRERELATTQQSTAGLLNLIPLFLMMAAFVGGMNLAIDTTAGERERGSLEPLLLNPVPRWQLVLGKWLATVVAATAVTLSTLAGFWLVLHFTPLEELGMRVKLGPLEAALTLLAVFPLTLLGAALQLLIASFARSFKEAQTYLNVLNLAPMLPSMGLMLNPQGTEWWMMLIPTMAQVTTVVDIVRGDTVPMQHIALAWASGLVLSALSLAVFTKLLGHEKVIYGR